MKYPIKDFPLHSMSTVWPIATRLGSLVFVHDGERLVVRILGQHERRDAPSTRQRTPAMRALDQKYRTSRKERAKQAREEMRVAREARIASFLSTIPTK